MIPLYDRPRDPTFRPVATLALIAANVLVALLTLPLALVPGVGLPGADEVMRTLPNVFSARDVSAHYVLVWHLGLRPAAPSVLDALTATFLHADLFHLLGNLLFLWVFGPNVERRVGRAQFVLLFLTAALVAHLLHAVTHLASPIPVIGASGAIFGVLGAYAAYWPGNRVRMMIPAIWFWRFDLPAWVVMAYFVALDLVPTLLGVRSNVAHVSHLAGFGTGVVLAVVLLLTTRASDAAPGTTPDDALDEALRLVRQGMLLDAHTRLTELAAGRGAVGAAAREHLAALERDPAFQRLARLRSV